MRLRLERRDRRATATARGWESTPARAMLERATRGRSGSKRTADEKGDAETSKIHLARGGGARASDFSQGLPSAPARSTGASPTPPRSGSARGPSRARRGTRTTSARGSSRVFAASGRARAALQVYPKTVRETAAFEAAIRRVEHLTGVAVVAFPHENKSKKLFVCARRDDDDEERRARPGKQTGTRSPPRCLLAWPHAAAREGRVARLRDKRGRGNRTLDTRDEAARRALGPIASTSRRSGARCTVRCGARGRGVFVARGKRPGPAARGRL